MKYTPALRNPDSCSSGLEDRAWAEAALLLERLLAPSTASDGLVLAVEPLGDPVGRGSAALFSRKASRSRMDMVKLLWSIDEGRTGRERAEGGWGC